MNGFSLIDTGVCWRMSVITLQIPRWVFPAGVHSGVHASAVLLNYGRCQQDSGIAMLPGELFGYGLDGPQRWLTLRGSLAVDPVDLAVFLRRLRELAVLLRGPEGACVVAAARARAMAVSADLDQIVATRRC